MKKRFLTPLVICISLLLIFGLDKLYYRDTVRFFNPIKAENGSITIRNDGMGDGHFWAKRKNGRRHKGIDILAPLKEDVYAAKSGWAVSGEHPYGYGKFVKIIHSPDLSTFYAHLDSINFKWIKRVRQGEVIGAVGKTGNANYKSMDAHLHFEVRKNGKPVNPLKGYLEQ